MSIASLTHTCPSCGAEESLDVLILRVIEDDEARRLVADVLDASLPVGGLVLRYLRLHKPDKQRLRMARVREVLAELVPDIVRGAITRKGREWAAPPAAWTSAFAAVFEAVAKGSLRTPLPGNAYLYEVLMRQADKVEGEAERQAEADRRGRAHTAGAEPVAALVARMDTALAGATAAVDRLVASRPPAPRPPPGPSKAALRIQAEIAASKSRTQTEEGTNE